MQKSLNNLEPVTSLHQEIKDCDESLLVFLILCHPITFLTLFNAQPDDQRPAMTFVGRVSPIELGVLTCQQLKREVYLGTLTKVFG